MNAMKYLKVFVCFGLAVPKLGYALDCSNALNSESKIEPVGGYETPLKDFEKRKVTHLHSVWLWRSGDCYFGLFTETQGLEGDPFYGLIDDFVYDPKTKALNFKSKITEGMISADVPSKDLFEFSGTFDRKTFAGTMNYSNKTATDPKYKSSDPLQPSESEKVILKIDKSLSETVQSQATYKGWMELKTSLIVENSNGPKW
jgi:hypothetical protein